MEKLTALQEQLGYVFEDKTLLETALTHRSYGSRHNERLEFLGDAVLDCVVALLLYERYAGLDEGVLSRMRASLVRQEALFEVAQEIAVSPFLRMGEGELKAGGFNRPSILADAMEALFGAIFLEAGFPVVQAVISRLFLPFMDRIDPKTFGKDAKTQLQEYLQGHHMALPEYHVIATHGAAHDQKFDVECLVPKLDIRVSGSGSSRRGAEQAAASQALELIRLKTDAKAAVSGNRKRKGRAGAAAAIQGKETGK